MSSSNSIINLADLSKPATVLIEKISDAIGGIFKPFQIRRVAQAEANAKVIRARTEIKITKLQQRAVARFFVEEGRKQANIESITMKAIDNLREDARPNEVEDDWISNFFDKCRLISDEEMQSLWAKVLAGEANNPGFYSKRTVNFISSIDKTDAILFTNLCSYGWIIEDKPPMVLLIYDPQNEIYNRNGIYFGTLKHFDDIGLISLETLGGYTRTHLPEIVRVSYYGTPINIKFKEKDNNRFDAGQILLSRIGQELAPISGSSPIPDFIDYILKIWSKKGYVTFSDWPKEGDQAEGTIVV